MLQEMRSLAASRVSFAFETTLSGRSYLSLLRKLKSEGYDIHIFFLWLKSVDLALSRIKERVSRGGHDVPEASSDAASIDPSRISCFTIGRWPRCRYCLITREKYPR